MVTAVAADKIATEMAVKMYYHAPADAATEQSVKSGAATTTWQALRDYGGFAVGAMTALKVGNGMIELSIYAAEDASATNATEIKTSGVIAADAIGDWYFLEVTAEEIAQLGEAAGYNFTHVVAYVDCHHNDDEVAVVYILYPSHRPADALTAANNIS